MFENVCSGGFWKSRSHASQKNRHRVLVNVYDMLEPSVLTNIGYFLGVGIYHSGVEVCGREYCFGGHEYENLTGVFSVEPKVGPPGLLFKQSIVMGYTELSEAEIGKVLQTISHEFVGTSYNLLTRNCNHFTSELCKRLVGKPAPGWINRAAKLGTMFPCVIPDEWIEPPEFDSDPVIQSPTTISSSGGSQTASPAMSCSSRTPLKTTTSNSHHHHHSPRQSVRQTFDSVNSRPTSPATSSSNCSRHVISSSKQSSRNSFEIRSSSNHHHHAHFIPSNSGNNNHRRSSVATGTPSRRPSGSMLDDRDSIILARPSSPFANDEYNVDDPVKEPDSGRPEVIRSATQLSISASFQELDRTNNGGPVSPAASSKSAKVAIV